MRRPLICTFMSMPFSKRLSGSDFISQRLYCGGSADSKLSLVAPFAFLLPPAVTFAEETASPSSSLPVLLRERFVTRYSATHQTRGFTVWFNLLTWVSSLLTHSDSFHWWHLSQTVKTQDITNLETISNCLFMCITLLGAILQINEQV